MKGPDGLILYLFLFFFVGFFGGGGGGVFFWGSFFGFFCGFFFGGGGCLCVLLVNVCLFSFLCFVFVIRFFFVLLLSLLLFDLFALLFLVLFPNNISKNCFFIIPIYNLNTCTLHQEWLTNTQYV